MAGSSRRAASGATRLPEEALYRELQEEIGLERRDVEILASDAATGCVTDCRGNTFGAIPIPPCIGQKQRWFLLRLTSSEEPRAFRRD